MTDRLLSACGVEASDGRPLHAYGVTDAALQKMRTLLPTQLATEQPLISTAQGFVLWAAEHIRSRYAGGQLTWEFVFGGLDMQPPDQAYIRRLVELGLKAWGRPLRQGEAGRRAFLYSLLAEGGLPEQALADAPRYRTALLSLIREIEAEGRLGPAIAPAAAWRALAGLPQALRNAEQAQLMAELALALVGLRAALPEDWAPGRAVEWLDANSRGWRQRLPLRLSQHALAALVQPALAAERPERCSGKPPVLRELRRLPHGSWKGVAIIAEGAILLREQLTGVDPELTLRLVFETGAAWRALPVAGGWELRRSGGGEALLPVAPHEAVLVSVYSDGRTLGEAVLDAGLSVPDEAPSLWGPADPAATVPEVLVPISGRGQARSGVIWLLTAAEAALRTEGDLALGPHEPGPGGWLWPVSGRGRLFLADRGLSITTGAETEAPPARLVACGRTLAGFGAGPLPVFLGEPDVLGAEGAAPLKALGRGERMRQLKQLLGGRLVEWVVDGDSLARLRLVVLPETLRLSLREIGAGRLRLEAEGLSPGWHLHLSAGATGAEDRAGPEGRVVLDLFSDNPPGLVSLRLVDPGSGGALTLSASWPAREPLLIDAAGARLKRDCPLASTDLPGWRGLLPAGGGALQLRLSRGTKRVAFPVEGSLRLAAKAELINQGLALLNGDGRVHLRLIAGGAETSRLEIGHYDWRREGAGPICHVGAGRTRLAAVNLDDPGQTADTEADGQIDLAGWLGAVPGLWYLQGLNDTRGVMRPFVWAAQPLPPTTREERVADFADEWRRLLAAPEDPGWEKAWAVIAAVRAVGSAAGLDQVLALARVPAAAVASVFLVPRAARAGALDLETQTALWWPTIALADWRAGAQAARARLEVRLNAAGLPGSEVEALLPQLAGEVLALRPELRAHLGLALTAAGLPPLAQTADGAAEPLAVPSPAARLEKLAQEAARRFDWAPQGAGHLRAGTLALDFGLAEPFLPLLHAPLVAAEAAAGLRERLSPDETLQLLALRATDARWFDSALPAAVTLARERAR